MVHGSDLENFKYLPKFLGTCLRRLRELGLLSAAEFLAWYRDFSSLSFESTSLIPIKLKNIRHDILKDDWSQLESENDPSVFLSGIFEFLNTFKHKTGSAPKKLNPLQVRRLVSYRYGLIHFFASLCQSLEPASEQDMSQCISILAE